MTNMYCPHNIRSLSISLLGFWIIIAEWEVKQLIMLLGSAVESYMLCIYHNSLFLLSKYLRLITINTFTGQIDF